MGDKDKDLSGKKPGEKEEGKFHYNPGNQSGKTIDAAKPEERQENNRDRIESRSKDQHKSR